MKEYTITFTAEITDIRTGDGLGENFEEAVATGDAQASLIYWLGKEGGFDDVHIRDFKLFVQEKEETHEAED